MSNPADPEVTRVEVKRAIAAGQDLVLFDQWLNCHDHTCDLCRIIAEELHLNEMPPQRSNIA